MDELEPYLAAEIDLPDLENPGGALYLSIVDFFVKEMGGQFFLYKQIKEESSAVSYILIFKNVNAITKEQLNLIAS